MTILTLQPDAAAGVDTQISSGFPANNFGISAGLAVGKIGASDIRRGLLMFASLIGSGENQIPSGSTIIDATLTLRCSSEEATTDRNVGVHRALTQWFEGNVDGATLGAGVNGSTWNNRNNNGAVGWAGGAGGGSGSDYAATATDTTLITAPGASYDWDVAADVQAWADGTASNFGWWLINVGESTTDSRKTFLASDYTVDGNLRPKLVINYTAPGGDTRRMLLLGAG